MIPVLLLIEPNISLANESLLQMNSDVLECSCWIHCT